MTNQRLSRSLVATVAGRGLAGGLAFVVTPIYIARLGAEAYGLFSFYLVLFATLTFLDLAVSATIIRALARPPVSADDRRRHHDVLRTGEVLSISTAVMLGLGIAAAAPLLARTMIHARTLPRAEIVTAIRLIGLVAAVQWPTMIYGGALTGLGRLVDLSLVRGGVALVQWLGGAALLWLLPPRIDVLFLWQAACLLGLTVGLRIMIGRAMPERTGPPRFSREVVAASWRFGAGAATIAVTASLLTQADKLLVSRWLPVHTFASYSLAFTAASVVSVFILAPAMSVAFPHFTRLHAAGDEHHLGSEYRRWTQLIVVFLVPATCVMALMPVPLLEVWLGPASGVARDTARYLPWVALGTMFNAIMLLPFNLQLASGWTMLSSVKNVIIIPVVLAALCWGIPRYGAITGAVCWLAINTSYYLIEVFLMHRRLLRDHLVRWWLIDTGLPIAATFAAGMAARRLLPAGGSPYIALAGAAAAAIVATLALIAALPFPRGLALDLVRAARGRLAAAGRLLPP